MKLELEPVGWVRTTRQDLSDDYWGGVTSTIEMDPSQFGPDAVAGLDQFSHIDVIYCFDRVPLDQVVTGAGHPRENPAWPRVGIFAQRKKNRPNRLGLTTCRLLAVEGTTLTVTGLDAIDGTPVLDVKPCVREFLVDKAEVRQPPWIGELMKDYFATAVEAPSAIHAKAAAGFQAAGAAYERGRPEYPVAAVDHLVHVLGIGPGRVVLDLGAGTGKFTRLVTERGATVVGVEPVEGMRRQFAAVLPGTEILEGSAERIPLASGSVDVVVAAQAFHWFDGAPALREIRRVLRPGGKLGLIWNARDESLDWVLKLAELVDRHEGDAPRYKTMRWRQVFAGDCGFSPLEYAPFRYVQEGTRATVVDRVASISFIAALPKAEREAVLSQVGRLVETHPATQGQARIALPYRTDVFWASRV